MSKRKAVASLAVSLDEVVLFFTDTTRAKIEAVCKRDIWNTDGRSIVLSSPLLGENIS